MDDSTHSSPGTTQGSEADSKLRVTKTFKDIDGSTEERGSMADLMSVANRIFGRNVQAVGDAAGNESVLPGINAYNTADYRSALDVFEPTVEQYPILADELAPHIRICRRVLAADLDADDHVYEAKRREWQEMPGVRRWLSKLIGHREPTFQLQCKYCGHYTEYRDPYSTLIEFLNNNICLRCGRDYPMPDYGWDGIDGQAYIYYRRSVRDYKFYKEFEWAYQVSPRWRFRDGKWVLEESPDDDESLVNWPLSPEHEDWGRRLGERWAALLTEDEKEATWDLLSGGGDVILRRRMPEELAEERDWYIRDMKRYPDGWMFDRDDLDMNIQSGCSAEIPWPEAEIPQRADSNDEEATCCLAEGRHVEHRVVNFPKESLGSAYVRPSDDEWRNDDEWRRIGEARGSISVPVGWDLELYLGEGVDFASLARLAPSDLQRIILQEFNVDDDDLIHLRDLTGLLSVSGLKKISDAGVAHLKGLTNLRELGLSGTKISDSALAHLSSMTELQILSLPWTGITDEGISHLAPLTRLRVLSLHGTSVTDRCLANLERFVELEELYLTDTRCTDAGAARLQGLLPNCDIDY